MNTEHAQKNYKAKGSNQFSVSGLTNENSKTRYYLRIVVGFAVLFTLTTFSFFISTFLLEKNQEYKLHLVILGFIKYLILLYIIYQSARRRAAQYLNDIFELGNVKLATIFIEKVAFGGENERITIDKGKIVEDEGSSPLILIGGPGEIQINLGNVALYETVNGQPKILKSRNLPWEINSFERLRETGVFTDSGKIMYAIIDTRDQFVRDLNLVSRTKDGIPIQIEDIKVIFSILRSDNDQGENQERNPFTFEENSVKTLIYKQNVMSSYYELPTAIQFPWNTTIIPLVLSELEKLIQGFTLSEIFASISEVELAELEKKEKEIEQIHKKTKNNPSQIEDKKERIPPFFKPRLEITEKFYSGVFINKASELGVALKWIDVGTWKIDDRFNFILEKFKEAHNLAIQNKKNWGQIKKLESELAHKQVIKLTDELIISNINKTVSNALNKNEVIELTKVIEENGLSDSHIISNFIREKMNEKESETKIIKTLRVIHAELISARKLFEDEANDSEKSNIDQINNALINITKNISHYP